MVQDGVHDGIDYDYIRRVRPESNQVSYHFVDALLHSLTEDQLLLVGKVTQEETVQAGVDVIGVHRGIAYRAKLSGLAHHWIGEGGTGHHTATVVVMIAVTLVEEAEEGG